MNSSIERADYRERRPSWIALGIALAVATAAGARADERCGVVLTSVSPTTRRS